ncbi:SIMPL domain-containing protein [bacterium]|nr:SIMPL domain-containing protein [bacterium]
MLEKIEKLQIAILGLLIAFGLIFAVKSGVSPFSKNSVTVTGSAYEIVTSDSGNLDVELEVQAPTKASAYSIAKKQLPEIMKYLKTKGFDINKEVEVKASTGYSSYKYYPNGNTSNEIDHYNFSQKISIKSDDVNKIKDTSLDITSLSDKGIDVEVHATNYSYSKLSDLKIELLKRATKDAKQRASAMLKSTNNGVGKIQSVKMGVFQITPVDSTEVSDMGINDTSTIEKKITAVSNVTFQIK